MKKKFLALGILMFFIFHSSTVMALELDEKNKHTHVQHYSYEFTDRNDPLINADNGIEDLDSYEMKLYIYKLVQRIYREQGIDYWDIELDSPDEINSIELIQSNKKFDKYKISYDNKKYWSECTGIIFLKVVSNTKPIISGINNVDIKLGDEFNIFDGVKSDDLEDGDLTEEVKVYGEVDNHKIGKYKIDYMVKDSDGNEIKKDRIITVEEDEIKPVNNIPEIIAEDKVIKIGDEFNALEGVKAFDNEDGDLTNKIEIIKNNVDIDKKGTYEIIYEVRDSKGAKGYKKINVVVKSNGKPKIIGIDNTAIKYGESFNLMTGVTAIDEEDGDLTSKIGFSGEVNGILPGIYKVKYWVEDSDGNKVEVLRIITVNEKEKPKNNIPTLEGKNTTLTVGDEFNPFEFIKAYDKEDGDITNKVVILENNVDIKKVGQYRVIYEITDSQGAKAKADILVTVKSDENSQAKDDNKQEDKDKEGNTESTEVIEDKGNNEIKKEEKSKTEEVKKVEKQVININNAPTIAEINSILIKGENFNPLDLISARDKEDGDISESVEILENNININKLGTYNITYRVSDSEGVKTTKTINVIVMSKNNPEEDRKIVYGGIGLISIGSLFSIGSKLKFFR